MAIVRPFRGLRPRPELARGVASPPYDVLSTEEAKEMARNNPISFLRINKAELEFDEGTDPYSEAVYQRGRENLMRLRNEGVMIRDEKPSFYLYRLTMNDHSQTGLVALASVDEYDRGLIKKHEHTRPEKVIDRANHIQYLEAQVGPVFACFKYHERVDGIFKQITARPPETDFTAEDSVRHELWVVDDDHIIADIVADFAEIPEMYIADGHHRSASASEVCRRLKETNPHHTGHEAYNYYLNVLFSDRELRILAYNRVVRDLNGMTRQQLLDRAAGKFDVSVHGGALIPEKPHQFGLYCERRWYLLVAKPGTYNDASPTGSIDTAILGDNFIAPILGIDNPKTDPRIDFVGGIRGIEELVRLVDSGTYKIAFSLYPTTIEQLLRVADAGEVMPPKSTWFEPKLRSGMVVNLLSN